MLRTQTQSARHSCFHQEDDFLGYCRINVRLLDDLKRLSVVIRDEDDVVAFMLDEDGVRTLVCELERRLQQLEHHRLSVQ